MANGKTISENITVVDSIMGSGKSTWAFRYINEHPDRKYIYVTPFLDEVERVKKSCKSRYFCEPYSIRILGRVVGYTRMFK